MELQTILNEILTTILIPLLLIATKYGVSLLKAKIDEVLANKEIKDNALAQDIIKQIEKSLINCIDTTTETFVKNLKENGEFTKENFEKAFNMTKDNFLKVLTEEKKEIIIKAYGDIDTYIHTFVESYLKDNKTE